MSILTISLTIMVIRQQEYFVVLHLLSLLNPIKIDIIII